MSDGEMAVNTWGVVRIIFGIVSLGCYGTAYFFHSRSDPCLAFEHKYMKGGENCGYKKIVLPLLALLAWAVGIGLMTLCKKAEDLCENSLDSGGRVKRFVCRFFKECVQIIGLILCSVGSVELSAHVVVKDGVPAKYELLSSFCCMISVLLMMLAVRTPEHYGTYDIVQPTFMSILLALGNCNLLGLTSAAALCFSYRVVIFFVKEIMCCFGRNWNSNRRLRVTARVCVTRSRAHLNDLEANIQPVRNDERGPIMTQVRNLREQLNNLENAIPVRARV